MGSKVGSNSQIGSRRELYFSCISEGKFLMVLSFCNCRSSVTPLEPVSCMSRILMMMTMMRSSQIPSSNKVSCLMKNEMASAINVINVFLLSPREWFTAKVWRVSSRACQYSYLWHWSLLPGQEDIYCHFQGGNHIPVLCRKGLIPPVSVPSYPKDRHTCPHPSTLLFCHHLYHSRQLLRHDQARHRVSTLVILICSKWSWNQPQLPAFTT